MSKMHVCINILSFVKGKRIQLKWFENSHRIKHKEVIHLTNV